MDHPLHTQTAHVSAEGVNYFVLTPKQPAPQAGYSLLLSLHGFGSDPFTNNLPPVQVQKGNSLLADCVVVAPHIDVDSFYMPEDLHKVLEEVASKGHIDRRRIRAAGFSMGGHAVTNLAVRFPTTFAAVLAVSPPTGLGSNPPAQLALNGSCCLKPRLFPKRVFACLGMRSDDLYPFIRRSGLASGAFTLLRHPDCYGREDVGRAKDVPIWLMHGLDDALSEGRRLANSCRAKCSLTPAPDP